MACVVEMNEIKNANSASSVVICILNGPQTWKHLSDSGKPTEKLPRRGGWGVTRLGFGFLLK